MNVADLSGRYALVTGGTDGIGKEIARGLASRGVRVAIVGRDLAKGHRAERELRESSGNRDVDFLPADLSLLRETNSLADDVLRHVGSLHYLVHSAGIVRGHYELTSECIESNFAINYLSRFALTHRLLPALESAGRPGNAARIVIIGGAARRGSIHFDNLNLAGKFNVFRMLGQVCRLNDVFTVELARHISVQTNPHVTVTNLKMGVARTGIRERHDFPRFMKLLAPLLDPFLGITAQQAASPALQLLLAPEFEGLSGALFLMIRKFQQIPLSLGVRDPEIGRRRLWELSQRLSAIQPAVARESVAV